jgi:hypothetical protein
VHGNGQSHDWGYSGAWSLRITAICGVVNGGEVVVADEFLGYNDVTKTVTVTCSPGKKVIGAGGSNHDAWHMKLVGIEPSADLTSVTVKVAHAGGTNFSSIFHASGVCVSPVRTQMLVTATSETSGLDKTVTVTCPGLSKVHGLGGGVTGGGQNHITRLEPLSPSTAILEASADPGELVQAWSAHVHAICA